jgi:hypothetical protein
LSPTRSSTAWIAAGQNAVYRVHNDSLRVVAFPPDALVDDANRVHAAADSTIWFGTPTAIIQWRHRQVRRFPLPRRNVAPKISDAR